MPTRDPPRTKQLSYERDRRNTYGENSKSSRKNIPLRKALVNRANRRGAELALSGLEGRVSDADVRLADQRLNGRATKTWAKVPDAPLGQVVAKKRARRSKAR